ncbi:MAG: hypothetical protein WDN46_06975 [Methylocella sp.]
MSMLRVYRYDDWQFTEGDVVTPQGDSFATLTDDQKIVETVVCPLKSDPP